MCGIFFSAHHRLAYSPSSNDLVELSGKLRSANAARGPDSQGSHSVFVPSTKDEEVILDLQFYASELWLRGKNHVIQPLQSDGNVLCWNGEIFDGMDVRDNSVSLFQDTLSILFQISLEENDGVRLSHALSLLDTVEQIRDLLGTIEGPYAFVYYQAHKKRLVFARDPLGRRSLLMHRPTSDHPYLFLASVSAGIDSRYSFEELCTNNIFFLDLPYIRDLHTEFDAYLVSLPRGSPLDGMRFAQPAKVNDSLPHPSDIPLVGSLEQIPKHLAYTVDEFIQCLDRSVMLRVRNIPRSAKKGMARLAILFSGGIDSIVITLLAHRHVPLTEPIDLLNVAFENPRKLKIQAESNPGGTSKKQERGMGKKGQSAEAMNIPSYDVPDRITGREGLLELQNLCPGRVWNFVEVNVPYEDSLGARQVVESLMSPVRTVMDLSLALALYFASSGVGLLRGSAATESKQYTSSARVLLNGLGSDELLGGYGRHRSAYYVGGWQSVIKELQLELDRVPVRNLGRDDRVISSHGKETRYPFLSLSVVNFLVELPVHHKLDPRMAVGLGDKMLLRLVAWKLGLHEASGRKKRAMQFGSRSARMDGERRGDTLLE